MVDMYRNYSHTKADTQAQRKGQGDVQVQCTTLQNRPQESHLIQCLCEQCFCL